jgi:hypothetical protein
MGSNTKTHTTHPLDILPSHGVESWSEAYIIPPHVKGECVMSV